MSKNQIKMFRNKTGLTQAELAEKCGWKQTRIANYEVGIRTPSIADARFLALALTDAGEKCTVDDLFPAKTNGDERG